ncbi:hypothetical protein FCH83_24490 [Pseudomonas putida]|nr:hypothetical protein [Pseudomonas putida]NTZ02536.1 hypothetical protein [Pseudomonas putida]NTZ25678.1 hypothetical protein [Pseudomonas putida]NTZ58080.1 hypothetical protein [Pseudomonas putida]NTZ68843.1 hypothetical protein [Pseudomonas putida]
MGLQYSRARPLPQDYLAPQPCDVPMGAGMPANEATRCRLGNAMIEAVDQAVGQSNLTHLRPGYSLELCPNPFERERGTEQPGPDRRLQPENRLPADVGHRPL